MKPARFGISILTEPEVLVEVMCERCGRDLSVFDDPLVVVNVRGLYELQAQGMDDVAQNLVHNVQAIIADAKQTGRAAVLDEDIQVKQIGSGLREALVRHARMCTG